MRIWTKWIDDYFGPNASRIGWQFLLHPLAKKLGAQAMAEKVVHVPMATGGKMADHSRHRIFRSSARGGEGLRRRWGSTA